MGTGFGTSVSSMVDTALAHATSMVGQMGPWISVYVALGIVALAIAIFRKAGV